MRVMLCSCDHISVGKKCIVTLTCAPTSTCSSPRDLLLLEPNLGKCDITASPEAFDWRLHVLAKIPFTTN